MALLIKPRRTDEVSLPSFFRISIFSAQQGQLVAVVKEIREQPNAGKNHQHGSSQDQAVCEKTGQLIHHSGAHLPDHELKALKMRLFHEYESE